MGKSVVLYCIMSSLALFLPVVFILDWIRFLHRGHGVKVKEGETDVGNWNDTEEAYYGTEPEEDILSGRPEKKEGGDSDTRIST